MTGSAGVRTGGWWLSRQRYRYAPVRAVLGKGERNIGVVLHAQGAGFFRLTTLSHGDLVRRLPDLEPEEVLHIESVLTQMEVLGREAVDEAGLLDRLATLNPGVTLGAVHDASTPDLNWSVFQHFTDYAHPQVAGADD